MEVRVIGGLLMEDAGEADDKIVAVSVKDPAFADYTDKSQLPQHILRQVRQFFEEYKSLENKEGVVEDMLGPKEAIQIIRGALELYRRLRRGELGRKG